MNASEYQEYQDRVEQGLDGMEFISNGAAWTCDECRADHNCACPHCGRQLEDEPDGWSDSANEPHFSWYPCDVCHRHEGGDRYPVHGFRAGANTGAEVIHLDACSDCVHYIEYGRLDDRTMAGIEADHGTY